LEYINLMHVHNMHRFNPLILLSTVLAYAISAQAPIAPLSNLAASQAHVVLIDHTPPISDASYVPRLLKPSTTNTRSSTRPIATTATAPCSNLVYCFVRPCQFAPQCPNYANAVCEDDYCGGCFAVWKDADTGHALTDAQCNAPIATTTDSSSRSSNKSAVDCRSTQCLIAPCQSHECPAYPDALCVDDYCNGCHAIFVHSETGNILTPSQCHADAHAHINGSMIVANSLNANALAMAQHVEGNFDNFDVIESQNGSRFVAVSEVTIVLMFVAMVCVLPGLYYCYYTRYMVKHAEQQAKRQVFHGLRFENEHSDEEFVDSDDDKVEPQAQHRFME